MELLQEKTHLNTPTKEEWDEYEHLFRDSNQGLSIIQKLRCSDNEPLRVSENKEITRGRIGGMNAMLKKWGKRHRLRPHPSSTGYSYIFLMHDP